MNKSGSDNVSGRSIFTANRRQFLQQTAALGAGWAILTSAQMGRKINFSSPGGVTVNFQLNGKSKTVEVDTRTTLLDLLRENLKMPGTKKGCDRGQCGACTVLVNGQRINACLTLAVMCSGKTVTTIEGMGTVDHLHPIQQAFLKHDAFQCGYCTPGQICSVAGLLKEGHAKTDQEIRENMSGNICRCGAYQNILEAIKDVQQTA